MYGLPVDDVAVFGADTDASPYDSGSYASSTTYITGKAVEMACAKLKTQLCGIAAGMLGCSTEEVVFEKRTGKADQHGEKRFSGRDQRQRPGK